MEKHNSDVAQVMNEMFYIPPGYRVASLTDDSLNDLFMNCVM